MLRAAAHYGHLHPNIVARWDALQVLQLRQLRHLTAALAPDASLVPDITDLTPGWLADLVAVHSEEMEAEEKAYAALEERLQNRPGYR